MQAAESMQRHWMPASTMARPAADISAAAVEPPFSSTLQCTSTTAFGYRSSSTTELRASLTWCANRIL